MAARNPSTPVTVADIPEEVAAVVGEVDIQFYLDLVNGVGPTDDTLVARKALALARVIQGILDALVGG